MINLHDAVKKMRKASFDSSPQITLGELIRLLKDINAEDGCYVEYAFPRKVPTTCDSYRGSYDELALGHDEFDWEKRPLLSSLLQHLENCVGQTFYGYKGGEFVMDEETPVWVDNYGECSNCGVVGVTPIYGADDTAYRVIINTDYCEY